MLRMTTRERSSRSGRALRIFYLSSRRRWAKRGGATARLLCIALLAGSPQAFGDADELSMTKRRQPGILTGMPFMANLAPRTFVDDAGRKLFLATVPRRIVSLAPSVTELLFALQAGDRVVGVTSLCDFPPDAANKPKVGQPGANLERILALQPDLLLAPQGFLDADLLGELERLKLPVFMLHARSLDDVLTHLGTLGRMLDRQRVADALAAELRARIQAVKAGTEGRPRPRVLYVLNMDPLITVGPRTFLHQLIESAGGASIAADSPTDYPRFSMESVLARDPEVLLFPSGATEGIAPADRAQWERWPSLSAVRDRRLVQVPSVLLDRPGPRLVDGLELLARALHPEAFPEHR